MYVSIGVVRVVKYRRLGWAGCVARMDVIRIARNCVMYTGELAWLG
jgi:hypothetical protein